MCFRLVVIHSVIIVDDSKQLRNEFTGAIVVGTQFESSVAVALVGSHRVEARSIVANVGIALAFVDVDAGIATGCQRVAVVADALERSLEVVAVAVVADSGTLVTFVNICHVIFIIISASTRDSSTYRLGKYHQITITIIINLRLLNQLLELPSQTIIAEFQ